MGRTATVVFASLHNCLINLPLSVHGPLLERGIAPQSLVIELSFRLKDAPKSAPHKAYLGWTGMPSQISSVAAHARGSVAPGGGETIEIDPQHAAMIGHGLVEGMQVSIELLRDLPSATAVNVTPLTADDWEILESNAEFVETFMLNQVRAVRQGSVIGCWVGGTTLVRFSVDSTEPLASPALLLTSSSELIVAPKSRHAPSSSTAPSKAHDLTASSTPTALNSAFDVISRQLVRVLPADFVRPDAETEAAVVLVSSALFRKVKDAQPSMKCSITVHPRPLSAAARAERGESAAPIPGLEKDAKSGGGKDENAKKVIDVTIKEGKTVPVDHVWLSEKIRMELGMTADSAFELVKFGVPLPSIIKKSGTKTTKDEAPTLSPKLNGSSSKSPPSSSHRASSSPLHVPLALPIELAAPLLAGVENQLTSIRSHVVYSLAAKALGHSRSRSPGILVTGASGAGKTALVQQITRELAKDPQTLTHTIYIDCSKHTDERIAATKTKMKDWFDEACWHAPTILVLDNLDRLLGAEVEHANDSFSALHLAHTFLGIASPALAARPIILLATAQSSASLHPLLSTTHLLGETISLRGPSKTSRREILNALVTAKKQASNLQATNLDLASVAGMTEGYLPADLRDLVGRAIHQAAMRSIDAKTTLDLGLPDFQAAQVDFVPFSLRDIKLMKSEVQWADIGGLHETRRVLRETLEWPTKYGAIFASCPLRLRSGLLLYGFPGCGKTMLASVVAKECGLNFISVKGPEILNKYIGASEKSIRDLFDKAQAAKPCILFFDEFDSIAPKRGHDSTGVTDRVVNQMLTQMDGAEGLDGVYVLAATSRPDLIDPALLRPGRLDKALLCDMPNENDRLEIMTACARKIALSPSVDLSTFAARTQGFSGADLQALIYNAHLDAIHAGLSDSSEVIDPSSSQVEGKDISYVAFGGDVEQDKVLSRAEQATVNKRLELIMNSLAGAQNGKPSKSQASPSSRVTTHVNASHLEKSLKSSRPSVPANELARLNRIYSEFVSGRSANGLPSGEASDEIGARSSLM